MKNTLRVLLVLTALTLTAAIAWAGDSPTKIGGTF